MSGAYDGVFCACEAGGTVSKWDRACVGQGEWGEQILGSGLR